jgi:hypothetical protein
MIQSLDAHQLYSPSQFIPFSLFRKAARRSLHPFSEISIIHEILRLEFVISDKQAFEVWYLKPRRMNFHDPRCCERIQALDRMHAYSQI